MEQLLIVEDDIGLNQGLCKALKADDRQIISCHDLKAAREQLLCGGVSLILLDINLPDGSGLELLREVKENMPGVPVILLTANDTDLDIVDGLERGADDYITNQKNHAGRCAYCHRHPDNGRRSRHPEPCKSGKRYLTFHR